MVSICPVVLEIALELLQNTLKFHFFFFFFYIETVGYTKLYFFGQDPALFGLFCHLRIN